MKALEIQQLAAILNAHQCDLGLIADIAELATKHNAKSFHAPSFIQAATVNARNCLTMDLADTYPPILDDLNLPAHLQNQAS